MKFLKFTVTSNVELPADTKNKIIVSLCNQYSELMMSDTEHNIIFAKALVEGVAENIQIRYCPNPQMDIEWIIADIDNPLYD